MEAYQSRAYQPLMFPLGWWGVVSFDLLGRGQCACLRMFSPATITNWRRFCLLNIVRSKYLHFSFCTRASGLPKRNVKNLTKESNRETSRNCDLYKFFKREQCRAAGTSTSLLATVLVRTLCSWFELSWVKLYRKWPEGKRKFLRVT